jgi:hypothetical protein
MNMGQNQQRNQMYEDGPLPKPPQKTYVVNSNVSPTLQLRQVKGEKPEFSLFDCVPVMYEEDLVKLNSHLDSLEESKLMMWAIDYMRDKTSATSFSDYVATLWKTQKNSNMKLIFGPQRSINVHREVLAHRCAYFRVMFNSGMQESTQTEIQMEEETYESMLLLLEYIYTNNIREINVNLLELFDVLDVYASEHVSLIQHCAQQMYSHELSPSNVCMVYDFARERSLKPLVTACEYYIILHQSEIDLTSLEGFDITEVGFRMQKITLASYDDHSFSTTRLSIYEGVPPVKVALYGIAEVGKTTLMMWLVRRKIDKTENYSGTIGVEFGKYHWDEENYPACQIWDTGGKERFRNIVRAYMRGSKILFACFSFDNLESFHYIR